jgi:transcriptional regulator with XRE-family HTH domain
MLSKAKPSPSYSGSKELKALGRAIRDLRLRMGHSQESFANEIDIDRSYMGCIERGEHNLALINLLKIAKALGMPLSQLLAVAKL